MKKYIIGVDIGGTGCADDVLAEAMAPGVEGRAGGGEDGAPGARERNGGAGEEGAASVAQRGGDLEGLQIVVDLLGGDVDRLQPFGRPTLNIETVSRPQSDTVLWHYPGQSVLPAIWESSHVLTNSPRWGRGTWLPRQQ